MSVLIALAGLDCSVGILVLSYNVEVAEEIDSLRAAEGPQMKLLDDQRHGQIDAEYGGDEVLIEANAEVLERAVERLRAEKRRVNRPGVHACSLLRETATSARDV